MSRDLTKTDRTCPKCGVTFGAVADLCVCVDCGHSFLKSHTKQPTLKNSEVMLLASVISANDHRVVEPAIAAIESGKKVDLLSIAYDALVEFGFLGLVDWRCDPEEVREAIEPQLKRHGITSFDWAFLDEYENWEQMDPEERVAIFYRLASLVDELGLVLTNLFTDSDHYTLTVLSPEDFSQIEDIENEVFAVTTCHPED